MAPTRHLFDRWTLDGARGTLSDGSIERFLRPKSLQVLHYLIEHAGHLVAREEVLDAVWRDVTVSDESLTQCVSELRQALGDADQRIIRTLPKRGYLFSAAVTRVEAGETRGRPVPPAASLDATLPEDRAAAAPRLVLDGPSVAVLPFANLSGDPAQDYLSDGMTEDVIAGLSRFAGLSVIARNSSFSYKGRQIDVRIVGDELGVRYIVEGSLRSNESRLRITARLVDALSGAQCWGEQFDRALGDVFAVQDEITRSIVAIAVAHLDHAEIGRVQRKLPGSWTAYDLTLQGDQALMKAEQFWDARYVYDARRLYEDALRIDPDSAKVRAKLGHTYVRAYADPASPDLGDRRELEQGFALAQQAVGLGPNLPVARAQLGWAHAWMKRPDDAIAEFERAGALNPSFADYRLPLVLAFAGEPERALRAERDCARLDPFYGSMLPVIRGIALYQLGRYPEALAALRECRGRAPHVPGRAMLAATLVRLGQQAEAKAIMADLLARLPELSVARWPMCSVFRNQRDADSLVDALRQAEMP